MKRGIIMRTNILTITNMEFRKQLKQAAEKVNMSISGFIRATLAGAVQWTLGIDNINPDPSFEQNLRNSINDDTVGIITQFIEECCYFDEKTNISCRDLRLAYHTFCYLKQNDTVSAGIFGRILWKLIPDKIRKTTIKNGVLVVAYGGINISNEFKEKMATLDKNLLTQMQNKNTWKKNKWTDDKILEFVLYCSAHGYNLTAKKYKLSRNTVYQCYLDWRKKYLDLNLNPLTTLNEEDAIERRVVIKQFVKEQCNLNYSYAISIKDLWEEYCRYCTGVKKMFRKQGTFLDEILNIYSKHLHMTKIRGYETTLIQGISLRSGEKRINIEEVSRSKMRAIDAIRYFLEERCELDSSYKIDGNILYDAFLQYREEKNYPNTTKAWLTKAIVILYPNQIIIGRQQKPVMYRGLRLKEEYYVRS